MAHLRQPTDSGFLKPAAHLAGTALLALFLSFGPAPLPARAATSPMLPVKSTVLVTDGRVDASMLVGSDAAPSVKAALAKIPVGFISEPLGSITLHRNELSRKLGSFATMFELPQRVQVLRKGAMLSGEEIAAKVRELCYERIEKDVAGDVQVDLSNLPRHVVLPEPPESWTLTPMSSNKLGMRVFQLEARCGETTVRQIIQADVSRTVRVAKLRRLVKRGECLSANDLIEETIRLRNDQPNPVVAIGEVVGKQLANFKSPGTIVRAGDLASACIPEPKQNTLSNMTHVSENTDSADHAESPALPGETGPEPEPIGNSSGEYLVKNGEQVEFTVKSGSLCLVVPAKALQNGRAGESIRLLNLQNKRPIKGIITAEGKVEHVAN
ncbi:MAG TPA: flagella basal body P-ring formation protein FlgA [Candidatus Ozemobacteraceae bacterium]|nr:flagella basal body P-ring formation protein FlgA [Candidatus Ozemobacteraceae bacterium]